MDLQQKRNLMMQSGAVPKVLFLVLLFGSIVACQYEYDATRTFLPASLPGSFTPSTVRLIDLGFHPAVASFLWANTMPEILDLFFHGHTEYFTDLAFLNAVDPKMSYPYAFSVLTLPVVPVTTFAGAVDESFAIGTQGLRNADPDWRIPYYMAINYYLQRKDLKDAAWYFNVAANTPGIPSYAERFALNFGINQKDRDRVRGIWETVYESTNDPATKDRAAGYIERLNDFDYLEAAAKIYEQKYGKYPASPGDLVLKGIISAVPEDPFGFTFIFDKNGTVDIDLTKLPAYVAAEPSQ